MGFLSPWFLGGLLAVAVPLYVHLLRQHKTTPLPFSSLMFFEKRTETSVQYRRLRHLLLLALRIALIVLLALLFANPFVNRTSAARADGRKLVVVAIDNSFSMRAGDRLGEAKRQALATLANWRAGDRGQVMVFSSQAAVASEPADSAADLQGAVNAIAPSDARSSYGELVRALRAHAQSSSLPVEAHVFSDMQKTSAPAPFSELTLAGNARIVLHPVVAADAEKNWFVETVSAPKSVFQPKKVRIQATVASAGTPAVELPVSLVMNGNVVETRKAKVPENGRATVEFYLNDASYGLNRGEVRIDSRDRLTADDRIGFALERKEASKVLFIYEARRARSLAYYRAALDATPEAGFAVEGATAEQAANLGLERYAFVVLSDVAAVPASLEANLKRRVSAGGSLLVTLGPAAATRPRVPVSEEAIRQSRYASRTGERFQTVASTDATHPALGRAERMEGVKFYQSVAVDPGKARVLARLNDETPLLLESALGNGRVLVFASTFDNIANDLPLSPSFVPFVEQSAQYLTGADPTPSNYTVDSYLELRRASGETGSSVEVLDPDGQRALSLKEAASARNFRLIREGFYEVRRGNGRNELAAVHADRRESNLEPLAADAVELWQRATQGKPAPGSAAALETKPFRFWWYLALAVLLMAVAESLLSSRYLMNEPQPAERRRAA